MIKGAYLKGSCFLLILESTDVALKNSSGKAPVITTTHRIINEDGTTEYFQLLMEQESAGTQLFFTRIGDGCRHLKMAHFWSLMKLKIAFIPS